MDKIKVNNQIVSMRKYVKQAKTRIINKCVKEIKLLENRKGEENQIAKCKRKAERLLLEVAILKKIKPDSVSKMSLSKAKDWKAILNQKNVPLEERCFAMIANYEPVQREVEKFLSCNNYLVPKITSLLQEWEDKAKLPPGRIKKGNKSLNSRIMSVSTQKTKNNNVEKKPVPFNQENKRKVVSEDSRKHLDFECSLLQCEEIEQDEAYVNNSDSAVKSEEVSEEETVSENDEILNSADSQRNRYNFEKANKMNAIDLHHNDTNSIPGTKDKPETACNKNLRKDSQYEKISQKIQDSNPKSKPMLIKSDSYNRSIISHTQECKPLTGTKKEANLKTALTSNSNSTKAVALLNLNELLDLDEIPIKSTSPDIDIMPETGKRKRDAFFLNDDEEVSSETDDSENTGDDKQKNKKHSHVRKKLSKNFSEKDSNSSYLRKKQNNSYKQDESTYNNFKNKNKISHTRKFDFRESKRTNKNFYSKDHTDTFEKNQEKHQGSFTKNKGFNGRDMKDKMECKTFKSKGRIFEQKETNSSKKDYNQRTKMDTFNKKAKTDEEHPMHPSWEAKRKLKESTKVKFQGKRTVFDE